MERFSDRAYARKPLAACSAFCLDHIKGYVFVEAKHSSDVKQVCIFIEFTFTCVLIMIKKQR